MKIQATLNEEKKFHPYTCKTSGKHPVRLVDGGSLLTEYKGKVWEAGDMGWYYLNQKEYDMFKANMKEYDIED